MNRCLQRLLGWLVPAALVPVVVEHVGYSHATARHIFLPWVLNRMDPTFLANDWFVGTPPHHLDSVVFLSWIGRHVPLPHVMFAAHVFSIYLLLWVTYRISKLLFESPWVFYLAVFLFLRWGTVDLDGNRLWLNNVVQHTFAVPLCVLGFYLVLKNRFLAATLAMAAATYVHIQLGTLSMLVLGIGLFVKRGVLGWKPMLYGGLLYLGATAPTLIRQLIHYEGGTPALSAAQYLSISGFLRHPHHLVASSIPAERYLAFLALLAIAWAPGIWRREPHRTVLNWCLTILALCAIGVVFVELIPIKLVIQLQLFRMTTFVQYFAVLYAADVLLRLWHEGDWTAKLIMLGTIAVTALGLKVGSALAVIGLRTTRFRALCFSLSGFAIALGLVMGWGPEFMGGEWGALSISPLALANAAVLAPLLGLAFSLLGRLGPAALILFLVLNGWRLGPAPFRYDGPIEKPYTRFCHQIKAKTPRDAVFLKDPTLLGFQLFAERAEVADWKWMPFTERDMIAWKARLADLAGLPELECRGWDECNRVLTSGYARLTEQDFLRLAAKYGAQYVIRSQGQELSFVEVFRRNGFILYEIPTGQRHPSEIESAGNTAAADGQSRLPKAQRPADTRHR